MADVARTGAAKRRRERRRASKQRWSQPCITAVMCGPRSSEPYGDRRRPPRWRRQGSRTHSGLRAPTPLPRGMRPEPLAEPLHWFIPGLEAHCPGGGVAPSLSLPVLADRAADGADSSSLRFLTASALEARRKEEEEEEEQERKDKALRCIWPSGGLKPVPKGSPSFFGAVVKRKRKKRKKRKLPRNLDTVCHSLVSGLPEKYRKIAGFWGDDFLDISFEPLVFGSHSLSVCLARGVQENRNSLGYDLLLRPLVPGSHLFSVRLWSPGLWTLPGDDFRKCRIQRFLVRQWIHVTASPRVFCRYFPYSAQCFCCRGCRNRVRYFQIVKKPNTFQKFNSEFVSTHVKNQMFELSREVPLLGLFSPFPFFVVFPFLFMFSLFFFVSLTFSQ